MAESILLSVKKVLGLEADYVHFDQDIIMLINSVFSTLHQLGVGPIDGYSIEDAEGQWDAFLLEDKRFNFVKTYVCLKVRLTFDPPTVASLQTAMEKQIAELEWRINVARELVLGGMISSSLNSNTGPTVIDGAVFTNVTLSNVTFTDSYISGGTP